MTADTLALCKLMEESVECQFPKCQEPKVLRALRKTLQYRYQETAKRYCAVHLAAILLKPGQSRSVDDSLSLRFLRCSITKLNNERCKNMLKHQDAILTQQLFEFTEGVWRVWLLSCDVHRRQLSCLTNILSGLTRQQQEQLYQPLYPLQFKEILRYYDGVTKKFPSINERARRSTAMILQNCTNLSRPYDFSGNVTILDRIRWEIDLPLRDVIVSGNSSSSEGTGDDRETFLVDQTISRGSLTAILDVEHWYDELLVDDELIEINVRGKSLFGILGAIQEFYKTENRMEGMRHTVFEGLQLQEDGRWHLSLK
ncbi:hypothetical protein BDP55DRAFT_721997 [Colletotrichum godetiae]|uniref:Uncharacterized protein n=1 Tax=Colletotrichum godetiae TaxID=1209918 RepID=A0AAJ0A559_9PEZI|nr:uncharacterized protein BDP55DRAFT_721997 [Colletotrichum godetiae]KAK1656660.1 hypothetical protein BDP55DRAFT_721997 [Colletotrichum godetiae]